jgi:hypothetical protein
MRKIFLLITSFLLLLSCSSDEENNANLKSYLLSNIFVKETLQNDDKLGTQYTVNSFWRFNLDTMLASTTDFSGRISSVYVNENSSYVPNECYRNGSIMIGGYIIEETADKIIWHYTYITDNKTQATREIRKQGEDIINIWRGNGQTSESILKLSDLKTLNSFKQKRNNQTCIVGNNYRGV